MTTNNGSQQNNGEPEKQITTSEGLQLLEQQIAERLAASGVVVTSRAEHPEWFPPQTTGAIFVPRIPRRRPSPPDEESATG
tara:strand:+ start:2488 stop:2730 length:243 start_codon:yes stop_codon:yes gene_type:complete